MKLTLDRSVDYAEPILYCSRRVRLTAGDRINEEQLLLNADRKRLPGTERVLDVIVCTQVST
jgi:hypothetical protein